MSSVPPATSTSQTTFPQTGAATVASSFTVRFAAEASAIHLDTHRCELALKIPLLHGSETEFLLSNGSLIEQDGFTLLRKENQLAGLCVVPVVGGGLSAAARDLYSSLFRILQAAPGIHLYRIWNYVPFINEEVDGMENYRHFNVGRWDAFRSHFGDGCCLNMPAASAVGVEESQLVLAFLAGASPVSYIENSEQIPAYEYPESYGPRPPSFSRGALVGDSTGQTVYLSGTASVKGHTTVAGDCLDSQLTTTIDNIGIIRNQLAAPIANAPTSWRAYVRDPEDAARTQEVLCNSLPSCTPENLTIVQANICREPLRVEVEGIFESR
jgi:chorismate lyase/3-hydroxybenzoate synthase